MPTLKAMWGPKGRQVMIETPAQPTRRYGIGAVDYHTGQTVVLIRRRKRRPEVAELLEALLEKHPKGRVYVAWDNAQAPTRTTRSRWSCARPRVGWCCSTCPPTAPPWLNPIEMLWRHFRREVTHCELFPSVKALIAAAYDFFERHNRRPSDVLSIIGSNSTAIT